MSSALPLLSSWHEKPNVKFKMNSKQWFRVKIQNKRVSNAFMIIAIALSHLFTASNATLSTFTNLLRDSNAKFVIEHSLNASILWNTFMPMSNIILMFVALMAAKKCLSKSHDFVSIESNVTNTAARLAAMPKRRYHMLLLKQMM